MKRDSAPSSHSVVAGTVLAVVFPALAAALSLLASPEVLVSPCEVGQAGGRLVLTLRTEPKSFNPIFASDNASRTAINLMMADLVHINRVSHLTEPALARAWDVTPDGRRYTVHLRRGIRFSDGHPLDADDVLFTFRVHLDEAIHSPWRDLLIVGGEPIAVRKLDSHTVDFEFADAYGAGERVFDSIAILPQHVLEKTYREDDIASAWSISTPPEQIVGLGPFRLKQLVPGERLILERNPHYWKVDTRGQRLPYLDGLAFWIAGSEQAEVLRFQAGKAHVIDKVSPQNFVLLNEKALSTHRMIDLGPGLDYNFLFFNLNVLDQGKDSAIARKQVWFRNTEFRRAISTAIDRESIVKLVYRNRATPLATHVTPGNKLWANESLRPTIYSLTRARHILRDIGFDWNNQGMLVDKQGMEVSFSILTTAGNTQRAKMATIVQEDLRKLGVKVQVVSIDFRSALTRIFSSYDYEACVLGLRSGDVDPTAETNVWMSGGATHLWHLGQTEPATEWEAEIDRLMKAQMSSTDPAKRKRYYDLVQRIVVDQLPIIPLVSPNILVGADRRLGNFRPGIMAHFTLWNAEAIFFAKKGPSDR